MKNTQLEKAAEDKYPLIKYPYDEANKGFNEIVRHEQAAFLAGANYVLSEKGGDGYPMQHIGQVGDIIDATVELCKQELLKQMHLMSHENGYPSEAVPKSTVLSLHALVNSKPLPNTPTKGKEETK